MRRRSATKRLASEPPAPGRISRRHGRVVKGSGGMRLNWRAENLSGKGEG